MFYHTIEEFVLAAAEEREEVARLVRPHTGSTPEQSTASWCCRLAGRIRAAAPPPRASAAAARSSTR